MENLLPKYQSAGDYGANWNVNSYNPPPLSRTNSESTSNTRSRRKNNRTSNNISSFSKHQSKQQKQQKQRAKSAGRSRRPGTAMQFFRPGSVLVDNVPKLTQPRPRQRPKTANNNNSNSSRGSQSHLGFTNRRRNETTLEYEGGTDTVFLTRCGAEEVLQQQQEDQHLAPTEHLLRVSNSNFNSERQRIRPQSAMSLGQRFRAKNDLKKANFEQGGDLMDTTPSGTRITVANMQDISTELFLSAPSGTMDVLTLMKGNSTSTTTRNLGKKSTTHALEYGDHLGALGMEEKEEHRSNRGKGKGSKKEEGFMFVLGAPKDLSNYLIKSRQDEQRTTIKWSNCSMRSVQVYWIDYNGKLCPRMRLEPGESYVEASWSTHPWYVQTILTNNEKERRKKRKENNKREGRNNYESKNNANNESTKEEELNELDSKMEIDNITQGCLVILSSINNKENENGGSDCLNVVYNPPTTSIGGSAPSKLSVSSVPKATPQGTTQEERAALQADSHIITDPLLNTNSSTIRTNRTTTAATTTARRKPPKGLRPSVVHPHGLEWGDRRAGRRPQSAKNSSREAIRILRDDTFRARRIRHSTRLIRMRQQGGDAVLADVTITICPGIVPRGRGNNRRRRKKGTKERGRDGRTRRTAGEMAKDRLRRKGKLQPGYRGISSSSSWK